MGLEKRIPSPCLNCTERTLGCHSDCEKYTDYRIKFDEMNNTIREAKFKKEAVRYYNIEMHKRIVKNININILYRAME